MIKTLIDDLDAYAYRLSLPKWSAFGMIFLYPATWSIIVYRFGNWIAKCRLPIFKHLLFIFYFILKRMSEVLTGIEIAHNAEVGDGLFIGHIGGVIIGNGSIIGDNPSFHEGVTIGGAGRGNKHGTPNIGNNVYFGAGAKVMGKIKVGDNVMIGANAVVGGVPAKVISYEGSADFVHYRGK